MKKKETKEGRENMPLWKKRSIFIICAGVVSFLVLIIFSYFYFENKPENLHDGSKIGLVTDIHAGSGQKNGANGTVRAYPRVYKQHFSATLDEMKKEGINLVIALGDNTNTGKIMNAETLVEIVKNKDIEVIWVKGNHDREENDVMKVFNVQKPYYYFVDKGDWRIIVLESSEIDPVGTGGIGQEQLDWLKNSLRTDKSVIVAMHHPVYVSADSDTIIGDYAEFQNILEKAGNVKYVLSGHLHTKTLSRTINGITYKTIKSLTLDEDVPNFEILTLKK